MVEFKKANIKMASQNASNIVFRKDYTAPDHQIESIDLSFDLIPTCTEVTSKIIAVPQEDRKSDDLILDGDDLTLVSIKIAGDQFDEAIIKYIRRKHNVLIGERTAEEIKMQIGCVFPRPEEQTFEVKGRCLMTGLPRVFTVTSSEMIEAFEEVSTRILEAIHGVLERTPPELVADISTNGIVMTGGGSLVWGFDKLIESHTGIETHVADDAISCVAHGTGKSLDSLDQMQDGTMNLSRRKQMNN